MQAGEILRRTAFNILDKLHGGKLEKMKKSKIKGRIVEGITEEYAQRRVEMLLDYAKKHSPYYKKLSGRTGYYRVSCYDKNEI